MIIITRCSEIMGSGVATYGALGHVPPPSSFGNSVHSAAAASLTVKISKITKEKHVLNFHVSHQKRSKTHVNRLKQTWNPKEFLGRRAEEKFKLCPSRLISWRRHWSWACSFVSFDPPQMNDLLLWKPKTVGKYDQIQSKSPLKC